MTKLRQFAMMAPICFAILALSQRAQAQEPDQQTAEGEDEQGIQTQEPKATALLREKWFHDQRAFPLDHIPAGARLKAFHTLQSMRTAELEAMARVGVARSASLSPSIVSDPSTTSWTSIGPVPAGFWNPPTIGGSSGRATSLVVDPRNSQLVYLGTAGGGVWKTSDGGANWSPLTDNQPTLATGAITLDPSNPNIIYVGTGEANSSGDSYYGAGILKSTDGGSSWTHIPGPFVGASGFGQSFGSIAVHPTNGQIVLAGNYSGIYRSANGGATWTSVFLGGTGYTVIFDPTNGNTVYATLGSIFGSGGNGIYKSQDAGQTWTRLTGTGSNVLPATNLGRIRLAMDPSSNTTLYASISNCCAPFSGIIGIYKTTDGGANWTKIGNPPNCCDWYGSVLAVHPKNPNILFAGDGALYRTIDAGQTWSNFGGTNQAPSLHPDMHGLAFSADGSVFYVANDGGAFSTTDSASPTTFAWHDLNATISTITFYPGLSIDPTNVNNAYGGTQDNGTEHFTGAGPWNWVACGDGGTTIIDPTAPGTVYVGCVGLDIEKITNGANGGRFVTGINPTDRFNFINTALAMDPSNPQRLYFGSQFVYQSTNGAASWTLISPDLTNGNGSVNTIGVAPSNPDVVYAATGDANLQVTTNATSGVGATWTKRSTGLPGRYMPRITIDAIDSATAYVAVSGFNGSTIMPGHVFKTTNTGTSWTDISGNLPDIPANSVVIDPDIPNRLYVGTDVGAFYTKDGGQTWSPLGQGLPNVVVQDIRLHEASRTLRAATHGRGMWDLAVPLAPAAAIFSVPSVTFSGQMVGSTSPSQTVNLSNGGDIALAITNIGVGGANASDFSQTNNCGASLAGGASCTINVSFAPTAPNGRTAQLTITDNAAGSPQAVSLNGTGLQAAVTLSANNENFASQIVGTSSAQSITLSDAGNGVLTVASLKISGTNAGDFNETDNCTPSVAVGANCSVAVSFKPTAPGARTATLAITDNAPGSPHIVALAGTATDFILSPATGAATTATVSAGQTATYQLSLAAVNGFNGTITLSCSGAPNASSCSVSQPTTPLGAAAVPIMVQVTTMSRSAIPPRIPWRFVRPTPILLRSLPLLLAICLLLVKGRVRASYRRYIWVLPTVLLWLILVVACGGGASAPPPPTGTPAGTFILTLMGTSGGATRTQQLTLIVQ